MPLLADTGFDIIDLENYSAKRFLFPQYGKYICFAEGVFNQKGDLFFISQMSTSTIYVIRYPELRIEKAIPTGGNWSKVIALSPDEKLIAVSNWLSDDISIIDAQTFKRIRLLRFQAQTPRGLAFTPDNKYLYAVYFGSGHIIKISKQTWQAEHILLTGGTNRDIVIDAEGLYAYISNMAYELVYVLDLQGDKILKVIKVGHKPNTIRLTPDNRYLYVSCRGPNNPENYELPSLEDGNIYVIDTDTLRIVEIIPGGNQPTGLGISPDGKLLAFSNFQDNNVEVYAIKLDPYESLFYNPPGYVPEN
ncbi:Antigen Lp49 [subsurface metagenome]